MQKKIFISYRRDDVSGEARNLYNELAKRYGKRNIFYDIDTMKAGRNFETAIEEAIDNSEIVLVLIGKQWVHITDDQGKRRLELPDDYVRSEIAEALKKKKKIIPVFLRGAKMPDPNELPKDISGLTAIQGLDIIDNYWAEGIDNLSVELRKSGFINRQKLFKNSLFTIALLLGLVAIIQLIDWGPLLISPPCRIRRFSGQFNQRSRCILSVRW